MKALSIRQPYAEQILRGTKRVEYRSQPTKFRGRFYIYAAKTAGPAAEFASLGVEPGDLPTGVVVGTAELVGCMKGRRFFEWKLTKPRRLARPRKPRGHPQPVWFNPF